MKSCYELSDYATPLGLLGSGKMMSVIAAVNETGLKTYIMSGLVTECMGDSVVTSINSEVGDASPTDETYCSNYNTEEASHLVTEDPPSDTATGKGLVVCLTCSDALCPMSAGVMMCMGSSMGLSCDCPGTLPRSDHHLAEESV